MDEQSHSAAQHSVPESAPAPSSAPAPAPVSEHDDEPSALLSRLRLIEDQPLQDRAEALAQLHDELRALLESGDSARPHA